MKNKNRRLISCLLSAILLLVMSFGFGTFAGAEESDSSKPVVWIVGDSTVSAFTDNYYYPRYGWGTQIDKYLDGTFEVKNIALSGRSSTSYTADKEYGELIAGMKREIFFLLVSATMMKKRRAEDILTLMEIIKQQAHLLILYMRII